MACVSCCTQRARSFYKNVIFLNTRYGHMGFPQILAQPLLHLSDWKPLGAGTMVLIIHSSQLSKTISLY